MQTTAIVVAIRWWEQAYENNRSKEDVKVFTCKNEHCEDYMKFKDADLVGAINISRREGIGEKPKSKKTIKKKKII